jgi:arylsulfatase A-like enzyme
MTNVVVYVSDALRADHLGCYGARFVRTPTIDQFAAGGARFEHAYATAPWTCPSVASMITGLYPHKHGHLHWDAQLDPAAPTLFGIARAYGYDTASFVFDVDYLFRDLPDANVLGTSEKLDPALDWIRAHRDRPFLLWFHSWATHLHFELAEANREEWRAAKNELIAGIRSNSASLLEEAREGYRRSVEYQSEVLFASFLESLSDLGLLEDTVIVFVSDHGESWGERFTDKDAVMGAFHMHGATLYDETLDVPLIIVAPEQLEPATVSAQVSLVDLMPTLAELIGAPIEGLDGRSLVPLVEGVETDDRPAVMAATDKGRIASFAVRLPPWKLIRHIETGDEEAYRIDIDARETSSQPDAAPPALRELLDRELALAPNATLSKQEEELVERRLRDLGYL